MRTHVKILGTMYLIFGALGVLLTGLFSSVLLGVLTTVVGPNAAVGASFLRIAVAMLTLAMLTLSLPAVICGWGLLLFKPWARIVGIILAAIELVFPPVCTLLGVYALWVLLNRKSEALFATATSPSN